MKNENLIKKGFIEKFKFQQNQILKYYFKTKNQKQNFDERV